MIPHEEKNIRVRVAGIIVEDARVLLIAHKKNDKVYWLLPGGGVDFGESLPDAGLERPEIQPVRMAEQGLQTQTSAQGVEPPAVGAES